MSSTIDDIDLNSSEDELEINTNSLSSSQILQSSQNAPTEPFNYSTIMSELSPEITSDDLNQAMGLAQNAFTQMQQNPEQINQLFGALLQGMVNNKNPEDVMSSVVNAKGSPFGPLKSFVEERKFTFNNLIDLVQKGQIDDALESLNNINSEDIKESEISATVKELIKIPKKESGVYNLINSIVNLSSSLNNDWLLEMYFETGDKDGVFTCVSNGATIEALSEVIDSGEQIISEMKERMGSYQEMIAGLKLERQKKSQEEQVGDLD